MLPATGTLKQISGNEIYLLIKYVYIKRILWRVEKRLSYIEDARCLKIRGRVNLYFSIPIETRES